MRTVLLLILSNAFMTAAWYGHLRYSTVPLILVILASWLIALPEYALQVPANRIGYEEGFTTTQLKIIQEVISVCVFIIFNWLYLQEKPTWRTCLAFLLILAAVIGAIFLLAPDKAQPSIGDGPPAQTALPPS